LVVALHPRAPAVLEIDILPSTYPSQVLYDHAALALPTPLLIQLYLIARKNLFSHLQSHNEDTYDAALEATAVILLFDPNHLTAANFRKKHIIHLSTRTPNDHGTRNPRAETLSTAIQRELKFLDSLLTSPLNKHTKSPTLWHQRLWLHQTPFLLSISPSTTSGEKAIRATRSYIRDHWHSELTIVMKAGERHPRNYYAWQYARQLFALVQADLDVTTRREQEAVVETLERIKGWCLQHPRDVSGWGFLVWVMERARDAKGRDAKEGDVGGSWKAGYECRRVVWEVEEWVKKYEWVGGSVEWFLKATKELGFGE